MAQSTDDVPAGPSIPIRASRDGSDGRAAKEDGGEADSNGNLPAMPAARSVGRDYYDYEFSDIDEITVRQLNEDILAYRYDLDYCKAQLEEADLTPQETRTLQLRTLDLNHQMRHCQHRIELIRAQSRRPGFRPRQGTIPTVPYQAGGAVGSGGGGGRPPRTGAGENGTSLLLNRREAGVSSLGQGKRPVMEEERGGAKRARVGSPHDLDTSRDQDEGVNTSLQRLGFWKCRLCSAPKYLLAGAGRTPAMPCKWPLKDISKMITHFTEMHSEHTPAERCAELGAALAQNRGPFEYWLRRTRSQKIGDGSIIDDCLETLLGGDMPDLLRRHSRAAANMATY
ncbi:hypothetical protein VTJ49DRAFT_892 [Mycothermus thermophilus]|uniref:Uncharacterized protein n=1 Tax=Humicola insolens TaxID=85995 RepID=A0ABR3VNZ1_HUMIN